MQCTSTLIKPRIKLIDRTFATSHRRGNKSRSQWQGIWPLPGENRDVQRSADVNGINQAFIRPCNYTSVIFVKDDDMPLTRFLLTMCSNFRAPLKLPLKLVLIVFRYLCQTMVLWIWLIHSLRQSLKHRTILPLPTDWDPSLLLPLQNIVILLTCCFKVFGS